MNLGRSPLLIESMPQRQTVDPRAKTQILPKTGPRLGQSDAREPVKTRGATSTSAPLNLGDSSSSDDAAKGKSDFHISLSQHTIKRMNRPGSEAKTKIMRAGPGTTQVLSDPSEKSSVPHDARFPTQLHHDVHKMSPKDAHKELDKIWSRRHKENPRDKNPEVDFNKLGDDNRPSLTGQMKKTGNKHMLPHVMPGIHHADKSVRERAWKMQAQAHANSVGDSYSSRTPEGKRKSARAKVRVVQGASGRYTQTQWAHKPSIPLPKGHSIVHSVISEWLKRTKLLLPEDFRAPKSPYQEPLATGLSTTQVLPPDSFESELASKSPKRKSTKTVQPPKQKFEDLLTRTSLIQELVTTSGIGGLGGVFATGLKPGDPIVSSTPRDQRDLPASKRPGGAVTTRDVGHTANTGAWVPDKKRRGIVLPDLSKIPPGRDGITRQLAAMQPSNAGVAGILAQIARSRG